MHTYICIHSNHDRTHSLHARLHSWGTDIGDKGFFTMDDDWFTEYVFEVVVKKSDLPDELRAALDTEPLVLPAWDPMGALA